VFGWRELRRASSAPPASDEGENRRRVRQAAGCKAVAVEKTPRAGGLARERYCGKPRGYGRALRRRSDPATTWGRRPRLMNCGEFALTSGACASRGRRRSHLHVSRPTAAARRRPPQPRSSWITGRRRVCCSRSMMGSPSRSRRASRKMSVAVGARRWARGLRGLPASCQGSRNSIAELRRGRPDIRTPYPAGAADACARLAGSFGGRAARRKV